MPYLFFYRSGIYIRAFILAKVGGVHGELLGPDGHINRGILDIIILRMPHLFFYLAGP